MKDARARENGQWRYGNRGTSIVKQGQPRGKPTHVGEHNRRKNGRGRFGHTKELPSQRRGSFSLCQNGRKGQREASQHDSGFWKTERCRTSAEAGWKGPGGGEREKKKSSVHARRKRGGEHEHTEAKRRVGRKRFVRFRVHKKAAPGEGLGKPTGHQVF